MSETSTTPQSGTRTTLQYVLNGQGKPGWTVDNQAFFATKDELVKTLNVRDARKEGTSSFVTKRGKTVKRPTYSVLV